MRIGLFQTVQWPPGSDQQQRYRETIEQCVLAEELGYDSVWLTEHHFTRHGITSDPLALLAHLAARTERIRLGTAVLVLPFHDPIRLAESIALVDHLSNGRLDIGIGRGYQWAEYNGFAMGFEEGSDRFEEALAVLLHAWETDAAVEFSGTYHSYNAASAQPRPVQLPHPPLWHATTSEHGMRRCIEMGWGIMLAQATAPKAVADLVATQRTLGDELGTCRSPELLVLARGMHCAPTNAEAERTFLPAYAGFLEAAALVSAPPHDDDDQPRNPFQLAVGSDLLETAICGDPDRCVAGLEQLAALGVEHVLLFPNMAGIPHETVVTSLRLFADQVLPRIRR